MTTKAIAAVILLLGTATASFAKEADQRDLERRFTKQVHPFLQAHCFGCHGREDPEAKLDLARFATIADVRRNLRHWEVVLKRLETKEMPPEDAEKQPTPAERKAIIDWIRKLRRHEAERHAGDPGPVLPRRLSNAEYDYTIRDLTGVDIRPTREFPVDPANEAGFDNSGESLTMSPALLKKYFAAARRVADHLVLLPDGITFAPHPAVTDTDRDKFCVARIVDFYRRQRIDYADYFFAAWKHRFRSALGKPEARLSDFAKQDEISAKYLTMIHAALTDSDQKNAGPLAELRAMWRQLPQPGEDQTESVRRGCSRMRDFVLRERKKLVVPVDRYKIEGISSGSQPVILKMDREISAYRRRGRLPRSDGKKESEQLREAVGRFCSVFPDTFVVSERGRMYLDPKDRNKGRYLSAGFHLMVGYYRDDKPLYDLILDETEQRELDRLWQELDFVARVPTRQYQDFVYFERAEPPQFMIGPQFDFARSEDKDVTSKEKMKRLATEYVALVRRKKIRESYVEVIDDYFKEMSARIREVQKVRVAARPGHVDALLKFAERAWRRPLTDAERKDLRAFYVAVRDENLPHEDAIRDVLVSVLMSPRFCYRIDVPAEGKEPSPLSDMALASRLSYFLWSSMPDDELLSHARSGKLHDRDVLLAQTKRMLNDPRIRGLATEFGGHWLDFRRFERHNGVNRKRFTEFTDELRQAMFEEPVRYFVDLVQRDGSVLDFLDGKHTLVNVTLAEHYGIPFPVGKENTDRWIRINDADSYGRGGLLSMSAFLTKNSPGLRTSPVQRGYWVVRRLLGEQIPAPPPDVPELPKDEAKLGDLTLRQLLARHREVKSCAACHERFDSIGLVFEGYGPIGERRTKDLGGRSVDTAATFPDGTAGKGVEGLRRYLLETRRDEFIDNLCRKLLAYALGRRLQLSDELTIEEMKTRLATDENRFSSLVETIVTSPQFLNIRGRDFEIRTE